MVCVSNYLTVWRKVALRLNLYIFVHMEGQQTTVS